ncbi:hypothetical protein [Arcobacter sp. CECT 8985]|uniref:hypothetical protein n=1 Tax=Arcobacter sp. CECT 8985 TaxID=1935424 RepID=UPI00100BDCF8|nr:hypothetical protein [Arcobacter sp. CECT 8985]RXJ86610.1 hypothetical protein CRU93_07995 [Arcobacter sp. CECT 8985]
MTFIPISIQLTQAIKSNNAQKVEELILNSDMRKELIKKYVSTNDIESLVNLLPKFKSKGLILNIKVLLDI